jgi:hypothetical protein
MATDNNTRTPSSNPAPTPPFGKIQDIPFRSDTPSETRLRAGTLCVFEDVVAGAVVMLLTPAGPTKPLRLLFTFDNTAQEDQAMSETTLTATLIHDDDGHDVTITMPAEAIDEEDLQLVLRRGDGAEYTLMVRHAVALALVEQLVAAVRTSGVLTAA